MKRKLKVLPKAVTASSKDNTMIIEIDEDCAHDLAIDIMNGVWDDQIDYRADDVDWGMYENSAELAEDIPTILYLMFGLQDGEDYQILNGSSIMCRNANDSRWNEVISLLTVC